MPPERRIEVLEELLLCLQIGLVPLILRGRRFVVDSDDHVIRDLVDNIPQPHKRPRALLQSPQLAPRRIPDR